ncbi:venom serine protease isoform X2 [Monomorium pharaonis]|uniref:venom serine protease isoform X2 n=1 Tax=Monomorium pharaonis TaxID=307658 RepID=UPI001745D0FC|nr:venom serine protease isoform X2 [Monomorium pharaonis]
MQTVKVILFGLLLSFLVVNGVKSDCNYFQHLEPGQTYYAYNSEFPSTYKGENHCIWKMESSTVTTISCSIQMKYDCQNNRLTIQFYGGRSYILCGSNNTFDLQGINPIITFNSQYNSEGRFLCKIQISNDWNKNCQCGWKKETRIVGGKETGINEYPMMSGLVDAAKQIIFCGGTIISKQYVITAAHCIHNKYIPNIGVIVGEHDTATGSETKATKLFRVETCYIHPNYQSNTVANNDVAVCKIYGTITFNAEVGPACLPFRYGQYSFANNIVTALGWGLLEFGGSKPTKLQKVDLNVITREKCQNYYPNVGNQNLCTFTSGKDTCQMDSGGPLLWQDPKTHNIVVVGITSTGSGCASNTPAVAMCLGYFINWIIYVTPDAQYCQID